MKLKKEYVLNKYISLRLIGEKTIIFVCNKPFLICKHLLLVDPGTNIAEEINSIDEAEELFAKKYLGITFTLEDFEISAEQEFWAHCSNLQAWVENDYDTRILHRNLAFPLLKKLMHVGDEKAKRVYKKEIVSRIKHNHFNTIVFILQQGFLESFSRQEGHHLLNLIDQNLLFNQEPYIIIETSKFLIENSIPGFKKSYVDFITSLLKNHDYHKFIKIFVKSAEYKTLTSKEIQHILEVINYSDLLSYERPLPILKELMKYDAIEAKKYLKKLISDHIASRNPSKINSLIKLNVLNLLDQEEIRKIFSGFNYAIIGTGKNGPKNLMTLYDLGLKSAADIFLDPRFLREYLSDESINKYLEVARSLEEPVRLVFEDVLSIMRPPYVKVNDKQIIKVKLK